MPRTYEQKYATSGWKNVVGAMTFFIVATATVHTGNEPDNAAQERLFASLDVEPQVLAGML